MFSRFWLRLVKSVTRLPGRANRPRLETLEDRVTPAPMAPANVGYYDMSLGYGATYETGPIIKAGQTPVNIDTPTGTGIITSAQLSGLAALFVTNPGFSYSSNYLDSLPAIAAAVDNGMTLVISDRAVGDADPDTILPGGSSISFTQDYSSIVNVNDNSTIITNGSGPGGAITNSSLDGGDWSDHGYAAAGTLPAGAKEILDNGNSSDAVTFVYSYGAGRVIYSTIPLDFYLQGEGSATLNANMARYADNLVAYAAAGGTTPAVPSISVTDASGAYNGAAFTALAMVTGNSGITLASSSIDSGTLSYNYYSGVLTASQMANAVPLGGAPVNAGTYTVVADYTSDNSDYTNIESDPLTFTISPANLTITAAACTKTYDGTTSAAAIPTVVGLQGTDTVTSLTEAYASKDVLGTNGSTLVVIGYTVNDGDGGADYTVSTQSASGTITPAPLTISAVSDSKTYDGTTASSQMPSVGTLFGTDTVTGLSQAFSSKDVLGTGGSTLVVTGYTVNDGDGGADYTVSTQSASGTITPAPLTISAVSDSKTYDGTTNSSQTPIVGTLFGPDTVTSVSQAFSSKNVLGTGGSTLVVTGYAVNDGNGGADYTVSTQSASGTITPAPLTISAVSDSKTYDGTTSSLTPIVGTLFGTDTVTGLSQAFSSKDVLGTGGSTLVVTGYTVNDGDGGADYTVTTASASGTITPAALTISAVSDSKTYDGTTTSSLTPIVGTLFGTDTVTGLSQAFSSKDVLGTGGSTLVVTGYSVNDGNGGADYTVATQHASGTITPAALTISAVTDSKTYDGTTTSSQTPSVGTLFGTDTVTGLSQAFSSKDVLGTAGSTLVVTGYTVNDGNGGADYTVATQNANGTITPAALTISAVSDSKTYDGTTTSTQTPMVGALFGTDSVTGLSQAFSSKDVLATGGSTLVVTGYTVNDGDGGADYTVTTPSASGTITPAHLTISAVSDSKTYDGTTTSTQTPMVGALFGTDSVTGLSQAFSSKDVLAMGGSTLVVTGYTVNDGDGGADYTVTTPSASGTITPAPLTISAVSDSKTYDGTTTSSLTPVVGTLFGNDSVTGLTQAFSSKNVEGTNGSTLVITGYTVNDGDGGKDYTVSTQSASGTITPAALTISVVSDSKTYDGTTNSSQTPIVGTLFGTDTVTGLSQAFSSKDVLGTGASTLVVTAYTVNDGDGGADYTVSTQSASGTITPAALTISVVSDSKTYDGTTNSSQTPVVGTLFGTDSVTGLTQAFSSKNVEGTNGSTLVITGYTVNDGDGGADYTVTTPIASGTITAAALTISAVSDSKTYDGTTNSSQTPIVATLFGPDTVTGLSQAFSSKDVLGTGGSMLVVTGYTVNDGNGGADYTVTTRNANGTITPASLTISAVTDSKAYDGTTTSTLTPSVGTVYGTDTVTGVSQAFSSKNVLGTGGNTLVVTGYTVNDGNGGADYTVTTPIASGTITPAALTISAVSDSKTYDGTTTSSLTPIVGTLFGTDTVTGLSQAFSSKDVLGTGGSTLVVTGYTVNDGDGGKDYTVSTQSASGTITPAALTISAVSDSKTYDGTTTSSLTPIVGTLFGTDTVTGLSQAFSSKDVLGTGGSTLVVTGYTVNDGDGGADYTVTTASASGTITPAALTISAVSDSKTYDGTTTSSLTPIVGTLFGTDTVTGLSQAFSSKDVLGTGGSTLVVTGYTVNDGNGGADYTVTTPIASGTITPAALTISAVSDSKTYDGTTTSSLTPIVGTLFGTDTVTGLSQAFSSKDVLGTGGSTLVVTGYTVNDGDGGADYTVTTASASGTITPAALTISAVSDSKTYDGTTTSWQTPIVGTLFGTDTVTGLSQAFTSKDVLGTGGSTLVVTGYTVNDGNGGKDYTVSTQSAAGTVNPYAFSYTIGNDSQTYGSPANVAADLAATLSTGVNGEDLAITCSSSGDSATAAAGSYPITATVANGTGLISNYAVTLTSGTLTVNQATPMVSLSNVTGIFNNSPYTAAASVTGVGATGTLASGNNLALSYTYFAGALTASQVASAAPLSGAPINAGVYTELAAYAGSTDYLPAASTSFITITPVLNNLLLASGAPLQASIGFLDPDASVPGKADYTVKADYNDQGFAPGTQLHSLPFYQITPTQFTLAHTFANSGLFTVTVVLSDGIGPDITDTFTVSIGVNSTAVNSNTVVQKTVLPGQTTTIALPGGLQVGLSAATGSATPATFQFALYASNPATQVALPVQAVKTFDLQVADPAAGDLFTFQWKPKNSKGPFYLYYLNTQHTPPQYTAVTQATFTVDPSDPQFMICTIPLQDVPVSGTVFSISLSNAVTQPTPVTPPLAAANTGAANTASDINPGVVQTLNFMSRTQTSLTVTATTDSQQTGSGNSQGVQQGVATTDGHRERSSLKDPAGNMSLEEQAWWFQFGDEQPWFFSEPAPPANKPESQKPQASKPNDEGESSDDMVVFQVEPCMRPRSEPWPMGVAAEPGIWTTLPGQDFNEVSMLPAWPDDTDPDKTVPAAALAPVFLLGAGLGKVETVRTGRSTRKLLKR